VNSMFRLFSRARTYRVEYNYPWEGMEYNGDRLWRGGTVHWRSLVVPLIAASGRSVRWASEERKSSVPAPIVKHDRWHGGWKINPLSHLCAATGTSAVTRS